MSTLSVNQQPRSKPIPTIKTIPKARRPSQASISESPFTITNSNPVEQPCSPDFVDGQRQFWPHSQNCACQASGIGCDCRQICRC
ncbi:uncharacterized protein VTP21DRAFT_5515 [Calcarisporiella thermophila]|uniref:uncharacterized protein n=1 Tax=Calcarisporiella thermophila TaxID=911321 RepID=UPI003743D10F